MDPIFRRRQLQAMAKPFREVRGLPETKPVADFLDREAGRLEAARGGLLPQTFPVRAGGDAVFLPIKPVEMGAAKTALLPPLSGGKRLVEWRLVQDPGRAHEAFVAAAGTVEKAPAVPHHLVEFQ